MKPKVSFERHRTISFPDWSKAQNGFFQSKISVGLIEENGKDFIKIDFADRFIGGYTIGPGLVQEEIQFITAPEHIGRFQTLLRENLKSFEFRKNPFYLDKIKFSTKTF